MDTTKAEPKSQAGTNAATLEADSRIVAEFRVTASKPPPSPSEIRDHEFIRGVMHESHGKVRRSAFLQKVSSRDNS